MSRSKARHGEPVNLKKRGEGNLTAFSIALLAKSTHTSMLRGNTRQKQGPYSMVGKFQELGVASDSNPSWGIRADEFLPDLRGLRGIKRYREMSENDSTVGAILSAMTLMVRSTPWRIEDGSQEARDLVEYSLYNLEDATFQEFISEVLTFLPYGFSVHEIVARPARQNANGWVTLRKLAPRAQWTLDRFDADENGNIKGVYQIAAQRSAYIPYSKLLHFRTTSASGDPAGRSVLRSAYESWYFARRIREIEAVAIERELNGVPVLKMPAEYMAADATDAQKRTLEAMKRIGRDLKRNELGFALLPSDTYTDEQGKISEVPMMSLELIASEGKRDIDTNTTILRYEQSMARSALADFVTLGSNDRGSFALSKSKSDLFLTALTGYLDNIAAVLNRKLIPTLCGWNGIAEKDYPRVTHGTVAPTDLGELGEFLRRLTLAGFDFRQDPKTEAYLREISGLPPMVEGDGEKFDGQKDPPEEALEDPAVAREREAERQAAIQARRRDAARKSPLTAAGADDGEDPAGVE